MGGSGTKFERVKEPDIKGLKYSADYDTFKRINRDNDEFMAYGRAHHGVKELFEQYQEERFRELQDDVKLLSYDDAVDAIYNTDVIPHRVWSYWFTNADSNFKPMILRAIMEDKNVYNGGISLAYHMYVNEIRHQQSLGRKVNDPIPFKQWLYKPMSLFRGGHHNFVNDDKFVAYSANRHIAEDFAKQANNSDVREIKIRPIDTLGVYRDVGEHEFFVLRRHAR